jgi:hypothetical protein
MDYGTYLYRPTPKMSKFLSNMYLIRNGRKLTNPSIYILGNEKKNYRKMSENIGILEKNNHKLSRAGL